MRSVRTPSLSFPRCELGCGEGTIQETWDSGYPKTD